MPAGNEQWTLGMQRFFDSVQTRNPCWAPLLLGFAGCCWCLVMLPVAAEDGLAWRPDENAKLAQLLALLAAITAGAVCALKNQQTEVFRLKRVKLLHCKRSEVEIALMPGGEWIAGLRELIEALSEGVGNGSLSRDTWIVVDTSAFDQTKLGGMGFQVRLLPWWERFPHVTGYSMHWAVWYLMAALKRQQRPEYHGGPWHEGTATVGMLLDRWNAWLQRGAER